jgi:hypothetical protein
MSRPLYIFDLDGTLALIDHRRAILDEPGRDDSKWRRFYAACDKDTPNMPVIRTLWTLCVHSDVWIFSGRSDEVRKKTETWLRQNVFMFNWWKDGALMMRRLGDHRPDHELKQMWLNDMLDVDRDRLVAVFDDRQSVVDMWRRNGVTCFQVAPGDF